MCSGEQIQNAAPGPAPNWLCMCRNRVIPTMGTDSYSSQADSDHQSNARLPVSPPCISKGYTPVGLCTAPMCNSNSLGNRAN